jgi:hypothetical protein
MVFVCTLFVFFRTKPSGGGVLSVVMAKCASDGCLLFDFVVPYATEWNRVFLDSVPIIKQTNPKDLKQKTVLVVYFQFHSTYTSVVPRVLLIDQNKNDNYSKTKYTNKYVPVSTTKSPRIISITRSHSCSVRTNFCCPSSFMRFINVTLSTAKK